jgi:hypothetical protein
MLASTNYTVTKALCQEALSSLPDHDFKIPINYPTGSFFYDPWAIKLDFKSTIWSTLLASLPVSIGEARIITLEPGQCYQSHADIDDRFHMNLQSEKAYLIDLDSTKMHLLNPDCTWHIMDASMRHSAANFGRTTRIQLVVRKLLAANTLVNPVKLKITFVDLTADRARFIFDDCISPWLNRANKQGIIANFENNQVEVVFDINQSEITTLQAILPVNFKIDII